MLDLESFASETKLLEGLKQQTVKLLKELCQLGKVAEVVGGKGRTDRLPVNVLARSYDDDSDGEDVLSSTFWQ